MKTRICIGQIAVYKFSEVSCALKRVKIESLVRSLFLLVDIASVI